MTKKRKEKENDKYNELAITINCCGVHQMFLNYSVKDTPNPLSPHPLPLFPCSRPTCRFPRFPIRRPLQDARDREIKETYLWIDLAVQDFEHPLYREHCLKRLENLSPLSVEVILHRPIWRKGELKDLNVVNVAS